MFSLENKTYCWRIVQEALWWGIWSVDISACLNLISDQSHWLYHGKPFWCFVWCHCCYCSASADYLYMTARAQHLEFCCDCQPKSILLTQHILNLLKSAIGKTEINSCLLSLLLYSKHSLTTKWTQDSLQRCQEGPILLTCSRSRLFFFVVLIVPLHG